MPSQGLLRSVLAVLALSASTPATAQVLDRIGNAVKHEAEAETQRQVRQAVRSAIRCAVGDQVCQDRARREGREVILVDERGNPVGGRGLTAALWHLTFGSRQWEGDAGQLIDDEVLFALHLVEDDEVTFYLFLSDERVGERAADTVLLAFDDGTRCRYPYERSAPFIVRLDHVDRDWVTGAYEGMVRCEGSSSPVRARGTFRLAR